MDLIRFYELIVYLSVDKSKLDKVFKINVFIFMYRYNFLILRFFKSFDYFKIRFK